MASNHIKCVIFDCDGTLIDSERLCIQAIVEVLERVGVNVDYEKVKDQFQGVKLEKIFGELIAGSSLLGDDDLTGLVRHYRQRCQELFTEQLTVIDGVYEVLNELKANNIAICIASNAPHEKMAFTLPLTKLDHYFEGTVYSALDANAWKPDPKLLHFVMDKMQVRAEECLFIDDSLVGVQAGIGAQVTTLYFSHAEPHKEVEIDSPYLHYISDMRQLLTFVQ